MKNIGTLLAGAALIAALVTGCGGSGNSGYSSAAASGTSSENSPPAVAGPTITIANMAFGEPLTVAPGAAINIVNNDSVEHSVTSDTADVFSQDVEGHENKTLTAPSQPGTYPFHCKYHPNMKGTLIVK